MSAPSSTSTPLAGTALDRPAPKGLDAIFRPRSVAVIGASRRPGSIGAAIFKNLLEHGFDGPVYPVNPQARVVQSVLAYPTVADIPADVDLAVIAVPSKQVLAAVEECGKKGVRGVVVITAGFKETGAEGQERERALVEATRRYGMRMIGPNCLGVLNTESNVCLDATFAPAWPPPGNVAFSSQSGALGLAILETAGALGMGISHFASVGNKADVSGNDLLEYWEQDPGTTTILLYLESFGNPRRFTQIARRVARTKPIVAVKSGRTKSGARAASSHTGSLAGADNAVDALCRQSGVIRTDTIEELFDVAMILANQPLPKGARIGIVTNAGGPAIMASDACESHGLELGTLSDATTAALKSYLPPEASVKNPVDMIASATPESFEKTVRLVLTDPGVDAVLAIYVPPIVTTPLQVATAIVKGAEAASAELAARGESPKPVLTCFMGAHGVPEGLRSLQKHHIPSYPFPESAAIALARVVRYARWRNEPEVVERVFDDMDLGSARAVVQGARARATNGETVWLSPDETRALLGAAGIPLVPTVTARTADEAAEAASQLRFPVAVKLASTTLTHKTEVGGVVLDLESPEEVRDAFRGIERRLDEKGLRAQMDGVTLQPMVKDGVEAIVGMSHDPSFGPVLMFGLGGVYVELLRDVTFRVTPVTDRDVSEMVRAVRGSRLLEGWRGSAPADTTALEEVIARLSQLVGAVPEIAELDLNPLKVLPVGQGCMAVDARIGVRA
ncbi:MAG: acetate--CoA ligase family protein [Candidatus Eisenbacteria bacterium]|nr:acetate--CoA ligase family protein [Candidatus Eisenbacteria bacterium]